MPPSSPTDPSTTPPRDDFSTTTKELIAKRAGYMCAFPGCRRLTVGPSEDRASRLTMVGVAAHISAAAVGGPRYKAELSREERMSERNGVWTCQTHGKLIDDNASVHTIEEITRWKKQHEDWVFARVANADNHLVNGISRIRLAGVGPFDEKVDIRLGRHNIVYGLNQTGKSTLCEAIGAFSGRANYARFANRWKFCRGSARDSAIEAIVSHDDAATTVSLTQQKLVVPYRKGAVPPQRLRIEVNGGITPSWPRALFNVVLLNEDLFYSQEGPQSRLAHALWFLAGQLNVDEQNLWDALDPELFATSPLGYRPKRRSKQKVEFATPGTDFYITFGGLSSGEQILAILNVLLKVLRTDPRKPPWLLTLDTGLFSRLDTGVKQSVFNELTSDIGLQTIFCVNFEDDAEVLKAVASDSWIGATLAGSLTIHTFL